jgi:hypothetical protein
MVKTMQVELPVTAKDRYWITQLGRDDLRRLETCACVLKLIGLLFECPTCGTVYGHSRQVYGSGNRGFKD